VEVVEAAKAAVLAVVPRSETIFSGGLYDSLKQDKKYSAGGRIMLTERQALIVWLHSLKPAKSLRKYGNVHYVSKKMKYVVLYCDQSEIAALAEKLDTFSFVKKVEFSEKPFLKVDYENSRPDKAKEYDYKIGV
jgi:uncharacterized protein YlbG (UPF0298 family)